MPIIDNEFVTPPWRNNDEPAIDAAELLAICQSIVKNYQQLQEKIPLAGGEMTGPLILSQDPVHPLGAVTVQYLEQALKNHGGGTDPNALHITGGTMIGPLFLAEDPSNAMHPVTLQYFQKILDKVKTDTPVNTMLGSAAAGGDMYMGKMSTSRRIALYLAEDMSDDNYVEIEGNRIAFITGSTTGKTTFVRNQNGERIYWEQDPDDGELGDDGYPYIDGKLIYVTTEETDWPVKVYVYAEQVKRSITFEMVGDYYTPVDIFGAGDPLGRNIARMQKSVSGLELNYLTPAGEIIGIVMGSDGYMDLSGLRRTTNISFANWSAGKFSETIDGDFVQDYDVEFDENGLPVNIYSDDGHPFHIEWPDDMVGGTGSGSGGSTGGGGSTGDGGTTTGTGENTALAKQMAAKAEAAANRAENAASAADSAQQAAEGYAAQAEDVVSHAPQIIDGTWWVWDAEEEEYVDTGEQVFDDPPDIEFDIDPGTGELVMTYPTGYGNPEFSINSGGYLEVTYGD